MKSCPFCGESILDVAIKCKHCGSMIGAPTSVAAPVSAAPAQSYCDERVLWEGKQSQWVNVAWFLASFFLVPLLIAIPRALAVHFRRYTITTQRIRHSSGILSRRHEQVELYRVKDVVFDQPLLQRLFGLGTLTFRTSDRANPDFVISAIRISADLYNEIRNCVEVRRDAKQVREVDFASSR